jgi:uncharacterized protein
MDPDVASVQASSKQAKEEFPQADTALRRCVSAARRLQDPLLELVKIDPRKLGLGQHQHEVDQEELRSAFDQVLVSAVSSLGIDVNTASADHLRRVAGLSQALSKAVVAFREAREGIRTRADLLDVPGIPGKAFEQASGFLRVRNGENPLDDSLIHPERYGQVTQMARDLGVTVTDLLGSDELIDQLDRSKYLGTHGTSGEPLGELSWDLLIAELRHPGVDPRPPFAAVDFDPQVAGFEDLQVGMDLDGIVTHLAAFGAFVDVGIAQEGLVHVSELCHGYIASPLDAVHVGQRVRGRVIELLPERKRFSLSLKALQPRPPSGKPRPQDSKTRKKKKRPGTDRTRGRDRDKPKDRVLEFRMDLSGLADLLDKS